MLESRDAAGDVPGAGDAQSASPRLRSRPSPSGIHMSCRAFHPGKCTFRSIAPPSPRRSTTVASYQLPRGVRACSGVPDLASASSRARRASMTGDGAGVAS